MGGQLVAAAAVIIYRLLRTPVAVEARGMSQRGELERVRRRRKRVGPTARRSCNLSTGRLMTDFAVVVALRFLVPQS